MSDKKKTVEGTKGHCVHISIFVYIVITVAVVAAILLCGCLCKCSASANYTVKIAAMVTIAMVSIAAMICITVCGVHDANKSANDATEKNIIDNLAKIYGNSSIEITTITERDIQGKTTSKTTTVNKKSEHATSENSSNESTAN